MSVEEQKENAQPISLEEVGTTGEFAELLQKLAELATQARQRAQRVFFLPPK